MQRELWRNRWLGSINELTALRLQRESWLDKENLNPHWSFIEFMCSYFDDLGIDNNYVDQLKNGWISRNEFEIIRRWHGLVDKYNSPNKDDYNHKSIIEDENWLLIIEEGKKAIDELVKGLDVKEVQILTEDIIYDRMK